MATTITRTGGDTVIARTGLTDITITSTTDVEITYNAEELWINILVLGANDAPIALEVADITTVNGVDVTGYTIEQLVQYIADNCFGIIEEINNDLTIDGVLTIERAVSDFTASVKVINTNTTNGSISAQRYLTGSNTSGLVVGIHPSGFGTPNFVFINQELNAPLGLFTNNIERVRIKENGVVNIINIPTSSVGLVTGDIWSDGGTLKIV